jgi:hypothetical protein
MASFFSDTHLDSDAPLVDSSQPMPVEGRVKSVSFSTLSSFERCPYGVYLSKGKGIPSLSGAAADRGSALHQMLEDYVNGEIDEVTWSDMRAGDYHADLITLFRHEKERERCIPELKLSFKEDMSACKWDDTDM